MAVDWSTWKPRLLYGAFFVLAFLLALRQTLPAAAVKERLVQEAALRGWQLSAEEVGPAGLIGVGLRDVVVKDKTGLSVPLEALELTLRPWPLFTGRLQLGLLARLYQGTVRGAVTVAGGPQVLDVAVERLDLSRVLPLRQAAGMELAGLVSGAARFTLPADDKGKLDGRADLAIAGAGLAGGQVPIPGFGSGLTIPRLSLGRLTAAVKVGEGKATFEKLGAEGGDATLAADGLSVTLQPRLEYAPIFGKAVLRLDDTFAARPEVRSIKALLDAALASAKVKDGGYQLQVFGTVGHLQARPLPVTP
jgi:type II secretion system protein N